MPRSRAEPAQVSVRTIGQRRGGDGGVVPAARSELCAVGESVVVGAARG